MLSTLEMHILEILNDDARVSRREIAVMCGCEEPQVEAAIQSLRQAGVLVGYQALINWEMTDREFVQAMIEVKVVPQREKGYDDIARRIMQYEEVTSVYLMSGGYDLMVRCQARTLNELASFVHGRLAVIDGVCGTSTHFMLKTYKYGGKVFEPNKSDRRQAVIP